VVQIQSPQVAAQRPMGGFITVGTKQVENKRGLRVSISSTAGKHERLWRKWSKVTILQQFHQHKGKRGAQETFTRDDAVKAVNFERIQKKKEQSPPTMSEVDNVSRNPCSGEERLGLKGEKGEFP